MATIQWRPEVNALTTPQSYWIRFVPRNKASREDIAADIARKHPNFNESDILTILNAETEAIQERLLNGEQVTFEGSFSYFPSFTGRLDSPDDPLPPFVEFLCQNAQAERLPEEKKLPLISTAQDTVLGLKNVLNPAGLLQLTGADMSFDRSQADAGCVIEGTQSGKTVQTRFGKIEDSEIILMPDIPA